MNIAEPIRRQARLNPALAAVIRADHSPVTYADLDRLVDNAAAAIITAGLKPGHTVGLAMAGTDEFPGLVAFLALARLGIASADWQLPPARMQACIVEPGLPPLPGLVALIAADLLKAPDAPPSPHHPGDDTPLRVLASSGTGGAPKFAMLTHAMLERRVLTFWLATEPRRESFICAVALGITLGCCVLIQTLWSGGTIVLTNPAAANAAIRRHQVTALMIAPASLATLVTTLPPDAPPPPSLHRIDIAGSHLPPPVARLVRDRLCPRIVSRYGTTETGPTALVELLPDADPRIVGIVNPGVELQATDAAGRPLPPGAEGHLRARTAQSVLGYLDDAEATASAFHEGWFSLGDLGSVDAKGVVRLTGRAGDVINAGGRKVAPATVENVLLTIPDVLEAAAFGVPDALGVTRIWAAMVARRPVPSAEVTTTCRSKLGIDAPVFVLQLNRLPRNPNGKILREELIKIAQTQRL